MKRNHLKKHYQNVPNRSFYSEHRFFRKPSDVSKYLWPSQKKHVRDRAIRFLMLGGYVDVAYMISDISNPEIDTCIFRLNVQKDIEVVQKYAVKIAKNGLIKLNFDTVHRLLVDYMKYGCTRKRPGRPKTPPRT